jgi:hypothetical protein
MHALLITPGGGSAGIGYATLRVDLALHGAVHFQEKMNQ